MGRKRNASSLISELKRKMINQEKINVKQDLEVIGFLKPALSRI